MSATVAARPDAKPAPGGVRRRTWLILALAALLVAAAVWAVAFSPLLGVRTVRVRGASTVAAADVRRAAAIPAGTPLVRLSAAAISARVKALAPVADAKVSVSYPSTVVITVVERTAVGYLQSGQGEVLVDGNGVHFRSVDSAPPGLPRLDPGTGDSHAASVAVATVAAALTAAERKAVTVVGASGRDVSLTLTDGRTVVWGTAERSPQKAQLLAPLLDQPGQTIDVSAPRVVVVH